MSLSSVRNHFSNPSVNTLFNAVGLVKVLTTALYGLALDSFNNAGLYPGAKVATTIGCSVVSLLLLNHTVEPLCHDDTGYFKPVLKKAASALGLGTGSLIVGMYLQNLPLMITGAAINVASHAYSFMQARMIVQQRTQEAEKLIGDLSQFHEFRALYEEAYKVTKELGLPPPEVRLERLKHGFNAEQDQNIIRIAPNRPASAQRSSALMEFGNLVQERKFREVREATKNGVYKSDEDFARAWNLLNTIL
ncbi:MAG TPA: hypothetical protein VLG44_08830 [Chlamydiales bacterium]|nr:hypothetical protein [Chlamydiales bacterium]